MTFDQITNLIKRANAERKKTMLKWCLNFWHNNVTILFFNQYQCQMKSEGILPLTQKQMAAGQPIKLAGTLEWIFEWTSVYPKAGSGLLLLDKTMHQTEGKKPQHHKGYLNQQLSNKQSSTNNNLACVSAVMSAALPVLLMLQGQRSDAMQLEVKWTSL